MCLWHQEQYDWNSNHSCVIFVFQIAHHICQCFTLLREGHTADVEKFLAGLPNAAQLSRVQFAGGADSSDDVMLCCLSTKYTCTCLKIVHNVPQILRVFCFVLFFSIFESLVLVVSKYNDHVCLAYVKKERKKKRRYDTAQTRFHFFVPW